MSNRSPELVFEPAVLVPERFRAGCAFGDPGQWAEFSPDGLRRVAGMIAKSTGARTSQLPRVPEAESHAAQRCDDRDEIAHQAVEATDQE